MLALKTGPGRAGDDFARLGLDIAEADFLVFFVQRQGVIAPGQLPERFQAFTATWPLVSGARARITSDASIAVSIAGGLSPGRQLDVVQLAEEIDLVLRVPRNAFSAVAELIHQRAEGREAFVGFG
jgi:hypothetical protein